MAGDERGVDRRKFLVASAAGAAGVVGIAAGAGGGALLRHSDPAAANVDPDPTALPTAAGTVVSAGPEQAGVTRPAPPQAHVEVSVWTLRTPAAAAGVVAELGDLISALADGTHAEVAAFGAARLTITVGIGPGIVRLAAPTLPGAQPLPAFEREELTEQGNGDLVIQICADDPALLTATAAVVARSLGGGSPATVPVADLLWAQGGLRGPARPDGSTRNPLGFIDGVIVPRSPADLDKDVWLAGDPRVQRGTIMVVRRIRLDVAGFLAKPVASQERIVGRVRTTGAPLSGGAAGDNVDLGAKTPSGAYVVPIGAHARRADPAPTGVGLMLRRSYGYSNGPADQGLLFICFQNDLATFVTTQRQIDELDDMLADSVATASGTFLILPGQAVGARLGGHFFGA